MSDQRARRTVNGPAALCSRSVSLLRNAAAGRHDVSGGRSRISGPRISFLASANQGGLKLGSGRPWRVLQTLSFLARRYIAADAFPRRVNREGPSVLELKRETGRRGRRTTVGRLLDRPHPSTTPPAPPVPNIQTQFRGIDITDIDMEMLQRPVPFGQGHSDPRSLPRA